MEYLLQVKNLTVCYGLRQPPPLTALNGVSFQLARGEAVGILGESGCGKTTLALAMLGLLPKEATVQRGEIIFQGTDLLALGERDLQKVRGAGISLVHQEPASALNPVLRVGHQVAEVLRAHQKLSARQAREESQRLLAQVGFAAESCIHEAFPHQLSGGQRQRVVIAQAIACQPALIVADEPTTALDATVQWEIMALLQALQQKLNVALMLITHDPAILTPLAQRMMVMYAGQIIEEGPSPQVLTEPLHPYTRQLLQCGLALPHSASRRLATIPGEPPNLATLPAGCPFALRCPDRLDACETRAPVEVTPEKGRRVRCLKFES